ncbi:Crp/Fnr family transcriptional regulator [Lipingzhangella sp. LS1_29]|uniref:Crp/Fnr family transcriptional regulator n=1 Tax=Lipingzhangella rawalii TaxID=2055835 RepID=A0ABU2H5Z8_9ACTN|nr:Crp/Fnr family transcriptional regulator [Lipingzhangella rawalii]MDS1270279.1 Crp/Fnr family transcriptional regulator [Lipingzhangella rawalii]
MDEQWCLSEVELFADLSPAEMEAIGAQAPAEEMRSGEIVYSPGTRAATLYIVKSGQVRLYRILPDGRTVTTGIAGPGTIFGEMDLLGLHMSGTWAESLQDGTLCLMSRTDVQRLLLADPRVATRIAERIGARIGELEQRLADAYGKTVAERTAGTLVSLAVPDRRPGRLAPIRLTHEQLAALVGTTREHATKALGEIADHGLVRLRRGRIMVLDPDALSVFAEGGYRSSASGVA